MAKQIYRISFTEDSTHKTLRTFRFSGRGLIVAAITLAVVLIGLIYSLIAFTPLRTTIPGYPDANSKKVAVQNAIKIDSLESMMTRWELYAENLSRVLAGEETLTMDSIITGNTVKYLSNKSEAVLAQRDSLLRETVQKEEQFDIAGRSERTLPIEGMHFFTPVKGVIAEPFMAGIHPGVDLSAPARSVVSSVLDGTVIFAGWDDEAGYCMQIQHRNNIVTTYKHNERLLKKVGDRVKAGTPVALLGSTGTLSKGDYLHFELWYNGDAMDPAKYISF